MRAATTVRRSIAVTAAPTLSLSTDRKTSPFATWEVGKRRWVPMANAFGTTSGPPEVGGTCTGVTDFCGSCYAAANPWPAVHTLLARNAAALAACGDDVGAMAALLGDAIDAYRVGHAKASAKAGRALPLTFRIHWSGDYFSTAYAHAWRRVVDANPDISFWSYTRSFTPANNVVPILAGSANHAVYVSVDAGNVAAARRVLKRHPDVRPAFCADTWEATEALAARFPGHARGPRCPELTGKLPMVNPDGVGACEACGLCVHGRNSVRFASEH